MFQNQTASGFERAPFPLWQRAVLFSSGYFFCAWLGCFLSASGGTAVSYWLPGGLYVTTLLLNRPRDWGWLAAAAFPANLIFDWLHDPQPHLLVISLFFLANTLQAMVGAGLVYRLVAPSSGLASLREFYLFLFFAGILSPALGATLGASTLVAFGLSPSFIQSWKIWWGGNAMAVLVLGPLILKWFAAPGELMQRRYRSQRVLEASLLLMGLAGALWYLLALGKGINSPKIPVLLFILWAGLRFGLYGASLSVFILAVASAFLTTHFMKGLSALEIASGDYIFTLQTFVAVSALVGMVPAIVLSERNRTMASLRESEASLRATIENTPYVSVQWFDQRGQVTYWNHASELIFGWRADEAIGKTLDQLMFSPEQTAIFRNVIAEVQRTGIPYGPTEFTFRHQNGKSGILLSTVFQIQIPSGESRFVCMDVDLSERKRAESLTVAQIQVLELIASGSPLGPTLDRLARMIEVHAPDILCSVLLLDELGKHLQHGSAPSLPLEYQRAIDGVAIGSNVGSCGTAAFRGEPVVVADIATDPLWADYKDIALAHGLLACWSTPILDPQRMVLGTFAIYQRKVGLPTAQHRQLIEMATHTAAVCIAKHRAELQHEQAVVREQQARIEYTLQLIASQEAERKRIAAELHDSMGQNLLLIKNLAQMAARSQAPAQAYEHCVTINHLVTQCIAEARQISRDLHPYQLDHLGLQRALEGMLETTAQATNLQFTGKIEDVGEIFSAEAVMNIYRIVQESVNNILKHSQARMVRVDLECDIHEVVLRICDDGCGFRPDLLSANKRGLGLKNIAERVRMLQGKFTLDSAPEQGTQLTVVIPIPVATT
jgi:PAS domain S-box-containing protein